MLRGLKPLALARQVDGQLNRPEIDVTAVVTVTDDGGSSGRLRREFDVLPPGDIRNCLVALAEDEAMLSRLFDFRFRSGRGLKGHSFGNLFLTALSELTGDFSLAVKLSGEVLAIAGKIYPSTKSNVVLEAELENGATVSGETRISRSRCRIRRVHLRPENCCPLPETLGAIEAADLICLGPGSLFTSVLPNLLVHGIPETIRKSLGLKAYFVNLMWQPGETMGFSASDHIEVIYEHAGTDLIDCAVVNTLPIPEELLRRYAAQRVAAVANDLHRLSDMGLRIEQRELLASGDKVRHDPAAATAVVLELAREGRRARLGSGGKKPARSGTSRRAGAGPGEGI